MSSWGKKTVSFLRISSLLEQDCSYGQGVGKRIGSCKANSKRRSGPPIEVLGRQGKEEHGRDKFCGAFWGSNSELKLRREERDQSRAHSMVLKEELVACSRSKRNLSQRLCETETKMLAIVSKYKEELNLATTHEHKVADEYAQVYAGKGG